MPLIGSIDARRRTASDLARRIEAKRAAVAVIGMGYVGVPLACAFVEAGFSTIGLDTDKLRLDDLLDGRSYLDHFDAAEFRRLCTSSTFAATGDLAALADVDVVLICVPTPLDERRAPDLSQLEHAAAAVAEHGHSNQLVVLESTTYPGTTRHVLLPALTGHSARPAPFVAYSPERIDPGGDSEYSAVPKLVAGIDNVADQLAATLYGTAFADVRRVADVETAEAAKLLENTFRAVNIALVNELKISFEAMGIDIWEVVAAAATKPFGFMPFYPGPGVGGHCIAVDPEYLAWQSRTHGRPLTLTEAAIRVNKTVPGYVVNRLADELAGRGVPLSEANVAVVGVAYKPGIGDARESPALALLSELIHRGAGIAYHDPYVPEIEVGSAVLISAPWESGTLDKFDAVVICTDHDAIDYSLLAASSVVIVDTRNAMARRGLSTSNVAKA